MVYQYAVIGYGFTVGWHVNTPKDFASDCVAVCDIKAKVEACRKSAGTMRNVDFE